MTTKDPAPTISELPELPVPIQIDWPTLNPHALGCGVEDRGLRDRYECAEYGWQEGVDRVADRLPEALYDAAQMRAYVLADRAARRSTEGWVIVPKQPTRAMLEAAVKAREGTAVYKAISRRGLDVMEEEAEEAYEAMLAAAPTGAAEEKGQE